MNSHYCQLGLKNLSHLLKISYFIFVNQCFTPVLLIELSLFFMGFLQQCLLNSTLVCLIYVIMLHHFNEIKFNFDLSFITFM